MLLGVIPHKDEDTVFHNFRIRM